MSTTILEGIILNAPVRIEIKDSPTHNSGREEACMALQNTGNHWFYVEKKTCSRKETCFYVIREGEERSKEDLDYLQDPKNYKVCDFHPNGFYKMTEDLANED